MKATLMYAAGDVRTIDVPDPSIVDPTDAIVRVTRACICVSDLWPYADMESSDRGQPMGHEAIGVIEEIGADVRTLKRGDVVVMPFAFSDGTCAFCHEGLHTACVHGGFFGNNGTNGAQAEALRVPLADGTLFALPVGEDHELMPSLLTLSDVMGTGHHAAVAAGVKPGDSVAVVGDGAVGLCGVIAAKRLGAEQILIMGRHKDRTALARELGATGVVADRGDDAVERVHELTSGLGVHAVLECVGTAESALTSVEIARAHRAGQGLRPHRRPRRRARRLPGDGRARVDQGDGPAVSSKFGFVAASVSLVAVFAASASPIPLYEIYRRTDALSHADLAFTAVAYFLAVMVALLVFGRLSNHLGRRPVALAALAVTAAGSLVLTQVHGVAPLIAGRALQGLGCGLASSALAAFIVDSAPASPRRLASAAVTGAPMVGLTVGALGSGALAEYGPTPRSLVYLIGLGALAGCAALLVASRETVARAAGAAASLRPQVRIPARARRLLPAAMATFLATWALGGFYQAFGPSVAAEQLSTSSALVAAAVFASLMAPSAIGASLAGRRTPASAQRLGMIVFVLAVAVILCSLRLGAVAPFIAATAVAGAAQGGTFAGSLRALLAGAGPGDRAGILSAIYLISYSGAAIPGVIAGQLSRTLSLFDIALGYGALAALACVVTLVATRESRGPAVRAAAYPTAT
jgi:threonine dehydrogenase-like Zn-dependent dehydrogenase/predicted MFS family arabinose efflux permease